jgi:hypothetical protein
MKTHRALSLPALITTGLVAIGCSGTYKNQVNFNPSEPIRIAVLPFAQIDDSGALAQADENYLIDNVALVSSKLKQTPSQYVQTLVQSELAGASLDVVTPAIVEAALVHNGFGVPGSNPVQLDLQRVLAADPKQICTKLVSCDAVLYGKVTKWDRSYYGIESVSSVGVDLRIVSANTGKVLFESNAKDSDSRGVSKGPTGFSNLVIEPIKGLDNEIITTLARDVVKQSISPLNRKSRPEFLKTAPPYIIESAHSAPKGLLVNGKLVVAVMGSPEMTGSFSIGNAIRDVPLVERSSGHYIGEYLPVSGDTFQTQIVTVSLQDEAGRKTSQSLSKIAVSYR